MENVSKERQGATSAAHEARTIACPHEMLGHATFSQGAVAGRDVNRFKNGLSEPVDKWRESFQCLLLLKLHLFVGVFFPSRAV